MPRTRAHSVADDPSRIARPLTAARFAAAWLAALTGCVPYAPVAPHVGKSGATRVRLEGLTHVLGSYRLAGRFEEVPPGTRIKEAVIARAANAPCRFGWAPAQAVLVRSGTQASELEERDVQVGDELMLFYTPENAKQLERSARLDLVLERGGREECVAIPLTGTAPEERWERGQPVFIDFAMGGSGYTPTTGAMVGDFDFRFGLGLGLGELRAFAGAGAGFGFCDTAICPPEVVKAGTPDERSTRRIALSVPMFVGVDMLPWQTGYFAFGSSVEYDLNFVRLETYTGWRVNWTHGFTVAPRIALTYKDPLAPGLSGGVKNGFLALDVPLGFTHSLGLGGDVGFRYGVRLVLSAPIH
jgi:hypothetical protein